MKVCDFLNYKIKILYHPDISLIGLSGRLLDETYNSFVIGLDNGKRIRVVKEHGIYEIIFKDKHFIIRGCKLKDKLDRRLSKKRCLNV